MGEYRKAASTSGLMVSTFKAIYAQVMEGNAALAERADCGILLDLNNIAVNHKNHGLLPLRDFVGRLDLSRVTYLHVAGHEFDERFGLYVDTHSQPVESDTRALALELHEAHGLPILLEWDNDVPGQDVINRELKWLRSTTT